MDETKGFYLFCKKVDTNGINMSACSVVDSPETPRVQEVHVQGSEGFGVVCWVLVLCALVSTFAVWLKE